MDSRGHPGNCTCGQCRTVADPVGKYDGTGWRLKGQEGDVPSILRRLKQENPHLRYGQIIVNALKCTAPSVFYAADDELLEALAAYLD